ncbi:MAG: dynamin family protein [Planctomycetota bacterium]
MMPVMSVAVGAKQSIDDLRELYTDLHRFGQDLRQASLRFQEMVRADFFAEHGASYPYLPDDPKDILNRSIDITRKFEFLVAVTGAFSSGKSTLLNLLLDEPDLLPASVIPMTAVCTVIRHGHEPRVAVRTVPLDECFRRAEMCIGQPFKKPFRGTASLGEAMEFPERFVEDDDAAESLRRFVEIIGRYQEIATPSISFAERAPYISGGGVLPAADGSGAFRYFSPTPLQEREYLAQGGDPRRWVSREWLALIRDVTLWVPSELLENNIVFLDLPGLNCREDYHRRAIQEYCNMADCIVVAAFQPGNQADEEVIANFKKLSANYQEKIFFVFNKVDQFAQEPEELVRAVDYLARDTIGEDFPRDRFFLTSAQLARARLSGDPTGEGDRVRLEAALGDVASELPGLDEWARRVAAEGDPGGVGHLRGQLTSFLVNDAYRTKIAEIVGNYRRILASLTAAASPTFEEHRSLDPSDILRKTVLDSFRHAQDLQRRALYRFRFDYLRGHEENGVPILGEDLKRILEDSHDEVQDVIRDYFDRPILSAPLREDPVSEFDLQIIADDASRQLRRDLQDLIIGAIHRRVRSVFDGLLEQCEFPTRMQSILRGAPDSLGRLQGIIERFDDTMLHSLKCIVRNGLFHMPRGRELKRLERSVSLARMKELLVDVFVDYYPSWIYENIYAQVMDHLWLSLFLDSEDLEEELAAYFRTTEGVVTGLQVAERAELAPDLVGDTRDLYRTVRMCQEIEQLLEQVDALEGRAPVAGVIS